MNATAAPPATARAAKQLTFRLGEEHYGIRVLKVREIIRLCDIVSLPQLPYHVRGVINLRGKVIPVVDPRVKFGLGPAEDSELTCIIVTNIEGPGGKPVPTGVIVDEVNEVVAVPPDAIEPAPQFGAAIDTACIDGMARIKGRVTTLLNIDRLLGGVPEAMEAF